MDPEADNRALDRRCEADKRRYEAERRRYEAERRRYEAEKHRHFALKRQTNRLAGVLALVFLVLQGFLWISFLFQAHRKGIDVFIVVLNILLIGYVVCVLVYCTMAGVRIREVLVILVCTLSFIVVLCANWYWHYGTKENFTQPLTRLDAIYFAVGTFGTSTGNILATSETARALQTIQMALDVAVVLFAIGMVVGMVVDRLTADAKQADDLIRAGDDLIRAGDDLIRAAVAHTYDPDH
jgi:hypothetical protein